MAEVAKYLYTRKEASYSIGVSIRTIDYLLANKQLKFRKCGKKILIPTSELSRWARADHETLTQHTAPESSYTAS